VELESGDFEIRPGSWDREQSCLILGQSQDQVFYFRENELLSESPVDEWTANCFAAEIANDEAPEARLVVPPPQINPAFPMGLAAGVYDLVSREASVTDVARQMTVFFSAHQKRIEHTAAGVGNAIAAMRWFRSNCPDTHNQLQAVLDPGLREVLRSVPDGFRPSNFAVVIGRSLGAFTFSPNSGLWALAAALNRASGGLPPGMFPGAPGRASQIAASLVTALRQSGVNILTHTEGMIQQCFERQQMSVGKLEELHRSLAQALPGLADLARLPEFALTD